jgi:hypothetical protein
LFQKYKIDHIEIFTHQNYVTPLVALFKNR